MLIGVLPSMLLSAGALFLLYAGFYGLFDRPASSAALIAWSGAGLTGTWALISAWSGRWTENTAPLLALGVVATVPLFITTVLSADSTYTLLWLLLPAGPVAAALLLMQERGVL